ncbi:MAG: four helix bundle protein [Lysobacterales bacterium]
MTKQPLPPITKIAERLLCDIEQAVRGFARYHKYSLGSDLRAQAMTVVRTCHRAWRERARQAHWINELVWSIDELKLSLQLGSQLHAFKSFAQFEHLIRQAEELGRQAGGWKRQQHPKSQNSAPELVRERAQILSGRAASAYAGANP